MAYPAKLMKTCGKKKRVNPIYLFFLCSFSFFFFEKKLSYLNKEITHDPLGSLVPIDQPMQE